MTTEFLPEQTIRYRTYVKTTLVEALNKVFQNHPDALLQRTSATIEYPRTEANFPSVVVRFFERSVFNAGVGHQEVVYINGESDSIEVSANLNALGSVQLNWPSVKNAIAYRVYIGTAADKENRVFTIQSNNFHDWGNQEGSAASPPTLVTSNIDVPQPQVVIGPPGRLPQGERFYRVTAISPGEAVKFKHYFYTADIEFAVYALSSLDRDLISDTLVQTIAMGSLEPYTNQFFGRVYPGNDIFPDANLHFIDINADQIQGFGDSVMQTPWGAEDDLLYLTSYRFGVFGELYSLPPKLTYSMVEKIILYPIVQGIDPIPPILSDPAIDWVSNDP